MKDVVALLRRYITDEALFREFIYGLQDSESAQNNALFKEFVRRITAVSGVPSRTPPPPGALMELFEQEEED